VVLLGPLGTEFEAWQQMSIRNYGSLAHLFSYVSAWNYSKIDQSKEASSRLKIPAAEMVVKH